MHILKFQVTLIEGREKCEIKLTKPLKFTTGRKDCISDDPEGRAYVTTRIEVCKCFQESSILIGFSIFIISNSTEPTQSL